MVTSCRAGKLSLPLPPHRSPTILGTLQTALIVDICREKQLLSFPPSLDPTNPLTCCRESKERSPKLPVPSAVPGLGCCAAEGSGKDWAPAKDVSALTRSGDGDDRGWGRRESHAQAGKEGRQGDEGEEDWGGIGSPGPSCPLCIAKASLGSEKAEFARVFSVSSKAPLKLGEREGGVGLYGRG